MNSLEVHRRGGEVSPEMRTRIFRCWPYGLASFIGSALAVILLGEMSALGFVAIEIPAGVVGAEPPGLALVLGNDFDVESPIRVTALGAFDSASDGLFASHLPVAIFDRTTGNMVAPVLTFSSGQPGVADGGA